VQTYAGCDGGSSVQLFVVQGGGHAWPAGDLQASEEIARVFF
jgi:poly(3-hydroxybutyrate) depolymerase